MRKAHLQDGTHVNAEMVGLGFASTETFSLDLDRSQTFSALELEALGQGRGLWGQIAPAATIPPIPTNTVAPPPVATQPLANSDPACPDVCFPSPPPN